MIGRRLTPFGGFESALFQLAFEQFPAGNPVHGTLLAQKQPERIATEMIAAVAPAPEIHIVMRIFGIYLEPGIDRRFQLDDIIDAI